MNPKTKNRLTKIVSIIVILWIINRFVTFTIFDTMISDGNEEIKDFVKKSFSWGIFFGALIAVMIKYLSKLLIFNNHLK